MVKRIEFATILIVVLTSCGAKGKSSVAGASPQTNGLLHLVQTMPLANVSGRIDHLSIDLKGQRLFVAALGNDTVEILDLKTGKVIHSISGFSEPQGILFLPELNKLFVANAGNGHCEILDGSSFAEIDSIELSGDADNIRYDHNSDSVIVGYGDGRLGFIDAQSGKATSSIELAGHPEAFLLESSGEKIFVNVPSDNQIAVVDRGQQKVISTWHMTGALANFPMALDEDGHRLFIGSRIPARLNIFDTETGKSIASLKSVGDVDDIFYDATHKLIFAIGGEGYIDIFSQQDRDHYQLLTRVPTAAGARTGLWVPELNRLYVAIPRQGAQQARIQLYELKS
jgi:YVTN family beta-propeller protein